MNNKELTHFFREEIITSNSYKVENSQNMIKLDAMENPYTLNEDVLNGVIKELSAQLPYINRYPSNAIYQQTKHNLQLNLNLEPNLDLLLGNGSDEIISILANVLPNNSYILSPSPSFIMYKTSAMLARLNFIEVNLNSEFNLNIQSMQETISTYKPKLIYLAYPNNPSGQCFKVEDIMQIIECANTVKSLVVIDEAYNIFTQGKTFLPQLSHIIKKHPNVLVMRTLSKMGLAGLRLGYIVGDVKFIEQINKARPPYNINILTQTAVNYLLSQSEIFMQQAKNICQQRIFLTQQLQAFGHVYPSDANFLLIKMQVSANIVYEQLKQHGILVKNLSTSHLSLANCLRISIGTESENRILIHTLDKIIQQIS